MHVINNFSTAMQWCVNYTSVILYDTMEEVQKKIKGIGVQYTRERQKTRKKSGDRADYIYTSKCVHFH